MKFILFNAFVIAALGYILFERGALDGSPAGEMASKAVAAIEDKAEPLLDPVETAEPAMQNAPVRPERERRDAVTEPQPPQPPAVTRDSPVPEPLTAERAVAAATAALSEPAPEVDPRVVAEPVAPEVAARRAVVLGSDLDRDRDPVPAPASASAESKPRVSAAERRKRLRAIAEEAELLSIELISQ